MYINFNYKKFILILYFSWKREEGEDDVVKNTYNEWNVEIKLREREIFQHIFTVFQQFVSSKTAVIKRKFFLNVSYLF